MLLVGAVTNSRALMYVIFMALVIVWGTQCIILAIRQPAQLDNARVPATGTVFPRMTPQSSGQ
jgi:hypothetical protein